MNQEDYLNQLHIVQLEILDTIDRVCKKYDIKYFLCVGTLLGAVRHKGFIPWDDDIDIGMMRDDYEKFIKVCLDDNALPDKYFLHSSETDKGYWLPFIKVRKNNTSFNEEFIEQLDTHKGIFVDIFPYDKINRDGGFFNKLRALKILCMQDAIYCKSKIKSLNCCRKKVLVRFFMLFSIQTLQKFLRKLLMKKNNKNAKYICNMISGYNPFLEFLSIDKAFPLTEIEFESKKYPCFNDYKWYLNRVYGNYMELPPKDKRVTHMPVSISFTSGKNIITRRIENENKKDII